jgi:hypothetical protein
MSEKLPTIQIDMHTENGENLLTCYYPKEEEKAQNNQSKNDGSIHFFARKQERKH